MKHLIPFTPERRGYLLKKILRREAEDVLALVEFPDGSAALKPGEWNDEYQCWVLEGGRKVFPRGEGGGPVQLPGGTPLIKVFAPNAGAISTEAALIARAEDEGHFKRVDEDGNEIDDDPELFGDTENGTAATDGGTDVADHVTDFPNVDGVEFRLSDADRFDPNPVQSADVGTALDIAESVGDDERTSIKWFLLGLAAGAGVALVCLFLFWLLGQLGSGGGGGAGGGTVIGQIHTTAVLAAGVV